MVRESFAPGEVGVVGWAVAQGLGQAPDMHVGGICDAQLLPESSQGLLPAPLVVQVEDTWRSVPILNCPRDQL